MERDPYAERRKLDRDTRIREMYERDPQLSMAAIGRMFKISRERVRQIINKSKKAATVAKPSQP